MGIMADRLNGMVIRVTSPDGRIDGVLRNRDEVVFSFRENCYRQYEERALERQLSRLVSAISAGYQQGYQDALRAAVGARASIGGTEVRDANRRRFYEEQASMVYQGMSPGARIFGERTGLTDWHFVIRDGALAELGEADFVAELVGAYFAVTTDFRDKMFELRAKHYGVKNPMKQS